MAQKWQVHVKQHFWADRQVPWPIIASLFSQVLPTELLKMMLMLCVISGSSSTTCPSAVRTQLQSVNAMILGELQARTPSLILQIALLISGPSAFEGPLVSSLLSSLK